VSPPSTDCLKSHKPLDEIAGQVVRLATRAMARARDAICGSAEPCKRAIFAVLEAAANAGGSGGMELAPLPPGVAAPREEARREVSYGGERDRCQ
jgi:hypothetical protein